MKLLLLYHCSSIIPYSSIYCEHATENNKSLDVKTKNGRMLITGYDYFYIYDLDEKQETEINNIFNKFAKKMGTS